jgi:ubiquinone/menaquinone biosynthesis C-methylase UbiE
MTVKKYFDKRSVYYRWIFSIPPIKYFEMKELETIGTVSNVKNRKVIDIGCGHGKYTRLWSKRGAAQVIGVDLSSKMIERSGKRFNFIVADALNLPIKDGSFDVATCIGVLNYYEDPGEFIKEAKRVGKELVLTFPKRSVTGWIYSHISGIKIHLKTKDELKRICRSSLNEFKIKSCANLTWVVTGR